MVLERAVQDDSRHDWFDERKARGPEESQWSAESRARTPRRHLTLRRKQGSFRAAVAYPITDLTGRISGSRLNF